jgi:hypothetical protein
LFESRPGGDELRVILKACSHLGQRNLIGGKLPVQFLKIVEPLNREHNASIFVARGCGEHKIL